MSLPLLPGLVFSRQLGKEKYHKSHYFDKINHVKYMFGMNKSGIGGDQLPGQKVNLSLSNYPGSSGNCKTPAWVAFDKQVLAFDAYYMESVVESRLEQYRVRKVKILFYLEDDTMQIIEPRIRNSGLVQGTLLKRHRIPKSTSYDDIYYTVHDLNVGIDICVYDRVYRIVSCDPFTENFLRKLGVKVGQPESVPEDSYTTIRKGMQESMQPRRPHHNTDNLRRFLDHDRHVLRFFCFWDDSDSLYGDPREMILNYYLADDTIEIREIMGKNTGRDAAPTFLKRSKLPKEIEPVYEVGSKTDKIILNVLGHPQRGGRMIVDSLKTGLLKPNYYKDSDLTIGSYINVYNRKFLICSMDEFTKEYYRTKYGINDFKEIRYTLHKGIPIHHEDPPYNGWGSEQDSLGNCHGLQPEPPKRDYVKFLEYDKRGYLSNILRFHAKLLPNKSNHYDPINQDRIFIISYFLADDTILVFEPSIPNSGIQGGKFLDRSKIKKPGQERYRIELPEYYIAPDLYVGAVLEINNFKFLIEDADEYAFKYMESHPYEFPYSNLTKILEKIRPKTASRRDEILAYFQRNDLNHKKTITLDNLICVLRQIFTTDEMKDHEIITIGRAYANKTVKSVKVAELLGVAQQQLRKVFFDDFQKMREACFMADKSSCGVLSREELRGIVKSLRINLPEQMLQALFDVSQNLENPEYICYDQFITNLNWKTNPYPACCEQVLPVELAYDWTTREIDPIGKVIEHGIMYEPFLAQLTPTKMNVDVNARCTPAAEDRPY